MNDADKCLHVSHTQLFSRENVDLLNCDPLRHFELRNDCIANADYKLLCTFYMYDFQQMVLNLLIVYCIQL